MSHTGWTPREAAMMREKRRIEQEIVCINLTELTELNYEEAGEYLVSIVREYQEVCAGLEDKIAQEEKL